MSCESDATVSVIILNWNKPEMTIDCVRSVLKHTDYKKLEVVVVDNGSKPEFQSILARDLDSQIKLISLSINRYFGEGNNIGAEFSTGEILIFLNNDVLVEHNWLPPLLKQLEQPGVGAVGPMFLYPDGRIQEVGAYIDSAGNSIQAGKMLRLPDERFVNAREVDYVSAACVALRRTDFELVGGFHYAYEPAYYEDTELCFAIRALGLSVIAEPKSRVIHFEHQTTKDYGANGALSGVVPTNQKLFVRRRDSGEQASEARRGFSDLPNHVECGRRGIADLYSPYVITPGGGEKYLLSMASVLHDRGFRVRLTLPEVYSKLRLEKISRELNIQNPICECLKYGSSSTTPDIFISMGNEVVPPVEAIAPKSIYHCQFPHQATLELLEKKKRLSNYQMVIVNSTFTSDWFKATTAGEKISSPIVKVLNPPVSLSSELLSNKSDEFSIVSVGRFFESGHSKRQDLLIEAFKQVASAYPQAKLKLLGSSTHSPADMDFLSRLFVLAHGLNVEVVVDASRQEIEESLARADVYWHGAGLNINHYLHPENLEHFGISVVEAMSFGATPFVFHKGGPAATVRRNIDGFHYKSIDELAEKTKEFFKLEDEKKLLLKISAKEQANKFSDQEFSAKFNEILDNFLN